MTPGVHFMTQTKLLFLLPESRPWADYYFFTPLESEFDPTHVWNWMKNHWYLASVISLLYLSFLALIQCSIVDANAWYKLKKPIHAPKIRTAWNVFLAIFSAVGFSRMAPALLGTMYTKGKCSNIT